MNPARLACGMGIVLVVVTSALLTAGSVTPFAIGLVAWALVPYAVWSSGLRAGSQRI